MGERGRQGVVHGRLEIRVGEDDVGALAAELEGDPLDRAGRAAQQRPGGVEAPGQRDHVDRVAVGQRLADALARPQDEVDHAGRDAGLLEQPGQVDRRERGEAGRLDDHRVARGQRRRDLPAQLQQRVVPWPDQPADADRLVDDPADRGRVAGVDQPAGLLVGEVRVVAEDAGDVGHVPSALAHRLAGVHRLEPGQLLEVPVDERGDAVQQRGPLAGRRVRPVGSVEGAASGRRSPAWTCPSVATSTSATTVASEGLTTELHSPSADATHSPSMNRLGTVSRASARRVDRARMVRPGPPSRRRSGHRTEKPAAFRPTGPSSAAPVQPGPSESPRAASDPAGSRSSAALPSRGTPPRGAHQTEEEARMSALPDRANVVVIGAGIVGNSMAYHLAQAGWRDIVLHREGHAPEPRRLDRPRLELHLPDRPLQGDDRVHARQHPPVPGARRVQRDRRHRGRPDARADGGAQAADGVLASRGASRAPGC